jgi:hypothetical protein
MYLLLLKGLRDFDKRRGKTRACSDNNWLKEKPRDWYPGDRQ